MQTPAHHSGVAIVAMPLQAVDRRALSQAWYDAMHLAEHRAPARVHDAAPPATASFASRVPVAGHGSSHAATAAVRPQNPPHGDARIRGASIVERRGTLPTLGRKIAVRLAALPSSAPKRVVLSAVDGRVQIVVRGEGPRARIIAICTPAYRERVTRALLEARYRLASHGIATQTTVRERIAC